ncbi:MAG: ABC transporter substrate-binding protein [Betaproteobacteria bacterium]|nr:ABC transporter substrate-binding protein [Betaproteobacteria bacterium]
MAASVAALALAAATHLAHGKTLRWASASDPQTMDPYSQNEGPTNNMNQHIYERLIERDQKLNIVPGLAESWQQLNDTTWRFKLRRGVKFQDGTPFTADDVVFSFERAAHPLSQVAQYARAMGKVTKIDDYTVEFVTPKPNPILLEQADNIMIMSKAWCIKNKVERPQDFKAKEETYAVRHANGTGPYVLKSREPDVRTVLEKNPNYWNPAKVTGNVTEVVFTPIKSDATRTAALLSGEIDVLQDPSLQDIDRLQSNKNVKVVQGMEWRVIFLGMDQSNAELKQSNVKGKNPFKDLRVREAFARAIDEQAIKDKVMRGMAAPTGCLTPAPQACAMAPEADKRLPYDPAAAKKLLAEAGYPDGFEVGMDCPNNRYVNDERICQAVVSMLAKVGVTVKLQTMPKAVYFPKLEKGEASFYMLGWGGASTDAQTTLDPVIHSYNKDTQKGFYNYGRYVNPVADAAIDAAAGEMNPDKRRALIRDALMAHNKEVNHIVLHRQFIPWASRANVKVVHAADNYMRSWWVTVN